MTQTRTLISEKQLAAHLQINRATIWRNIKSGNLPKPLRITVRKNRWVLEEVEAFIIARNA